MADSEMRAGEIAGTLPPAMDAGIYFIGLIRTPWRSRAECPRRGTLDGPVCSLVIGERWQLALTGIEQHQRLQVLYWMHQARRDLVLQAPRPDTLAGTFALRSPVRPNPIASSIVELVSVRDNIVEVRGLDCINGTPLIDVKPERGQHEEAG